MAVSTIFDDKLVCGRSVMNYTDQVGFLEYTVDGIQWDDVKRPYGVLDNNIRAIASDSQNIYAGLQNGGMWVTSSFGESWTFVSNGLPGDLSIGHYTTMVDIDVTDEYIYATIYEPHFNDAPSSGLYRFAKADLPGSNVEKISPDNHRVFLKENYLYIENADEIQIMSVNGFAIGEKQRAEKIDISNLATGVYIYKATVDNKMVAGKFVKK